MFLQTVIEQLAHYVYFLRDPNKKKVFYVGKGNGNRIFDHISCALNESTESDNLDRIRAIKNSGNTVEHFVLRHGLSSQVAFAIEAAVIDFVGISNLSNLQSGHFTTDFGIKTTEEVSQCTLHQH